MLGEKISGCNFSTVKTFRENFLDEGKISIVHHFRTPAVHFRFKSRVKLVTKGRTTQGRIYSQLATTHGRNDPGPLRTYPLGKLTLKQSRVDFAWKESTRETDVLVRFRVISAHDGSVEIPKRTKTPERTCNYRNAL